MADKKISELNSIITMSASDLLVIVDIIGSETKKVTFDFVVSTFVTLYGDVVCYNGNVVYY